MTWRKGSTLISDQVDLLRRSRSLRAWERTLPLRSTKRHDRAFVVPRPVFFFFLLVAFCRLPVAFLAADVGLIRLHDPVEFPSGGGL